MPTRSSAGAELTCAGRAFVRYALSNIRVWEEMGQQVAFRGIMQSGKADNTRVGISLSSTRLGAEQTAPKFVLA